MDELRFRAGEKLEAFHSAAKSAAGNGKTRVSDIYHQTAEALLRIKEIFREIWRNEMVIETRAKIVDWSRDTVKRIKEGAPPLSPVVLYEEILALFRDRVWRRTMLVFLLGVCVGGGVSVCVCSRYVRVTSAGPHSRALHALNDIVTLVEDATQPSAGAGEVLIRVQAFSVCERDRAILRGHASALRSLIQSTPLVVGRAFSGVVLDVGAGVGELELGDEVWGCVSEWSGGAATELITTRSSRVSKRPSVVSADAAAALCWGGTSALYALDALRYDGDCSHKRVCICGASSGEGTALIQLLSARGARVTVMAPNHTAATLQDLGAGDHIDPYSSPSPQTWSAVEHTAAKSGPWDAVLVCNGPGAPATGNRNPTAILKSTAPRHAIVDLRQRSYISDKLPTPLYLLFAVSFYSYRALRWLVGKGTHTDWLEDKHRLSDSLTRLTKLVEAGELMPVLDKVYLPQDFEMALAHACSDDAIGTTVIRFP